MARTLPVLAILCRVEPTDLSSIGHNPYPVSDGTTGQGRTSHFIFAKSNCVSASELRDSALSHILQNCGIGLA